MELRRAQQQIGCELAGNRLYINISCRADHAAGRICHLAAMRSCLPAVHTVLLDRMKHTSRCG